MLLKTAALRGHKTFKKFSVRWGKKFRENPVSRAERKPSTAGADVQGNRTISEPDTHCFSLRMHRLNSSDSRCLDSQS